MVQEAQAAREAAHAEALQEMDSLEAGISSGRVPENADMQEIVHSYGRTIALVSPNMLTVYPAAVFPESLLAYNKDEIATALSKAITYSSAQGEKAMQNHLEAVFAMLPWFLPDEEALARNQEIRKQRASASQDPAS
ncbi:MAG: hypothetical protein EXR51_01105 [Dehalococcoidia bacterium]|nr:hypothetical protein [Dehalococcoidia bacterium]